MSIFVFLAGPPGVGKRSLRNALIQHHPDIMSRVVRTPIFTDRPPKPRENTKRNYHFVSNEEITRLCRNSRFIRFSAGDFTQAIDLEDIEKVAIQPGAIGLMNVSHGIGADLSHNPRLARLKVRTVFLSPISSEEACRLKLMSGASELRRAIENITRGQLRVMLAETNMLAAPLWESYIDRGVAMVMEEMKDAHHYHYLVPCRDGSDHPNWRATPVKGDAAKTLKSFAAILKGEDPDWVGRWPAGVFD